MAQQRQPHRISTCHRHPSTPITGFCAPCLSERLAGLDSSSAAAAASSSSTAQYPPAQKPHSGSKLRRSKSCCGTRPEYPPEPPRRKSCDARNRSTLSELFHIDDDRKGGPRMFEMDSELLELKEAAEEEEEDNVDDVNRNETRVCDLEFKTMKELIDLEWRRKKGSNGRDLREIAGTFWESASNKVKQWRRKQKKKVEEDDEGFGFEKKMSRKERRRGGMRETQSEVGEYALGRRSCDTDPDPGRMSLDELPRASWDGYVSCRAYPRMTPMVAVVEEAKMGEEEGLEMRSPGGSAQTKDYYFSQRRRRSFDRSSSCGHSKGVMAAEVDGFVGNAGSTELFYGAKVLITEKELMESSSSNSKSVEDDNVGGGVGDGAVCGNEGSVSANGVDQKPGKWHKKWKFWGSMQRKSQQPKNGGEERDAENWKKLRRVGNEEANGSVSQKLIRSYSVSCRNSCKMVGLFSTNVATVESKGSGLKALQRNRSARYSPSNLDHGLLRFYLTPLRSHRRSESGKGRVPNNINSSQSLAKNML